MRSDVAPGQLVNSSSCRWRNCIRFDIPVDVSRGQPEKRTWVNNVLDT